MKILYHSPSLLKLVSLEFNFFHYNAIVTKEEEDAMVGFTVAAIGGAMFFPGSAFALNFLPTWAFAIYMVLTMILFLGGVFYQAKQDGFILQRRT